MPFIFWGMGPVFQGGKQNIIVEIGKEKFSTQEFIDFVRRRTNNEENLDNNYPFFLKSVFFTSAFNITLVNVPGAVVKLYVPENDKENAENLVSNMTL